MKPIAERAFCLSHSAQEVWARVYKPEPAEQDWACWIVVDDPIGFRAARYGVSSMQALDVGLKTLSLMLYASPEYKAGQLGVGERFDGDLSIPAISQLLDAAPHPFTGDGVRAEEALSDDEDLEPVAEETYDLAPSERNVRARIFAPTLDGEGRGWACRVSVDAPLALERRAFGATSLQALFAGLAVLSDHLYGSPEYRGGRLRWCGKAGSLLLPATAKMLDVAPYPF